MVLEVNEKNFQSEVMQSEIPVVVDFWAPWCGPCRMLAPVTERLADTYAGKIKFCKINVDENPNLAAQYGVMSIPTLIFFKKGEQKDSVLGTVPERFLKPKIDALIA